jgi:DNA-binding CsgD family transcriptional regulator
VTLDPNQVQELAARGLSYEQIAQSLAINFKTLLSHRRNREEIQEVSEGN